jgi:catechol 2,3-dioxygenase-like lactoylglutathione lyase family enzyme
MPVNGVDHVNIRTNDVAASARFYVDIFDFEYRRGPVVMGNQSNWLFDAKGSPIIHFRQLPAESASTGPIDHVALACSGKADILARLSAHDIAFSVAEGLVPGVTQVFLKDPHGVMLELNFSGE